MRLSNKGFSLVELMVVVAIIGILAAIAVPNFQKFAAKSKQSEAKSNLSAMYSAERAFYSEWNTFYGAFVDIGYAPVGTLRYSHGFTAAGGGVPANYSGPKKTADYSTATYCADSAYSTGASACVDPGKGVGAAGAPNGSTGTAAAFLAGAVGDIGGKVPDQWTINETKVLNNNVSGI